ncbi:Glycosyltransferase Gtf1 [Vibrio chagasii]|nr:Glycosyltransferase Gtf1 [Vibrio chagasii]CAH7392899.1 Glycosyltransferase Gtf1 [Vibrio chagasii]CAH7483162.1 Glycosyltransferase Gtf1 [Vibrio chagasii]
MIYILSFLKVNNINGVSTFCNNIISVFGDKVKVISFFNNKDNVHESELCIKIPYNKFFKLINWLTKYRLSAFLFSFFLPKDTHTVIINAPSMIRYIPKKYKIIAVQHHRIDTLINNKANFNNDQYLIEKFRKDVDKFVVLSEKDKQEAIFKLNLSSQQVAVIPHMVKINKAEKRLTCNKRLVMLARLFNKQKRFDLVLGAMAECPDWELDIYGEGPDRSYILGLIKSLGLKNARLHPPTNDVQNVLEKSDVHLMTSDYEGFGFSNIEAMRKGLPLIIRNTFPAAESLVDGNGKLLSHEWSVEEFLLSLDYISQHYEEMSHRSLLLSEKFSPVAISESWVSLVEEVESNFDK